MAQPSTPIRLLITHREADEAILVLARGLAQLPDFEVYITREGITSVTKEEGITFLPCPPITGKFNLSVIRLLRRYAKEYGFDLTYSPGSSGLSNALMATLGLRTKNVACAAQILPITSVSLILVCVTSCVRPSTSQAICVVSSPQAN